MKEMMEMRKILWICALAAGVTMFHAATASAQTTVILRATLTGGEETPNPVLTGAVGTVEVAVDPVNQEIVVELHVWNLPTGSTASHIHIGPKPTTNPVVIDFPIGTGRTGDFALSFRVHDGPAFHARPEIGITTFADALQAVAAGNGYVNVHTTTNPGGEIRGQLVVVQTFPTAGQ
jgi:Cu/Zn superoxide dismutase